MKIKIKDKEIELKNSFRAFIIYESMQGKVFNPQTMTDIIAYLYSVVLASAKGVDIEFDEFMDWLDDNPSAIGEFMEFLTKSNKINGQFGKQKKTKK